MPIDELFSKFKFIRSLSLSRCFYLKKVPDSIGNLNDLCSLDLSLTDIEELPESICSLYNLQILKLSNCQHLKELPSNLHELTNLRVLELVDTKLRKVPAHLGKRKNLQVWMTSFDVEKSSKFDIQQLGELNLCGRLSIQKLQNILDPDDAASMELNNKTHLVELKLKWDSARNPDDPTKERDEIVIENLQPSEHLQKLSINKYTGKILPSWFGDNTLLNVVSLKLFNCEYCEYLPPLGLWPFLKDLNITGLDGIVSIEADFYGNRSCSFPSLETLEFSHMKEWEKWECPAVTNAFPHLQHLYIDECPKLKGNLPKQLHHLKKLRIQNCEQLVASLPMAPEIDESNGTSVERLGIKGHSMLESVKIHSCRGMNIPMSCHHNFLVHLTVNDGCDSLTTFSLDMFPTLRSLDIRDCSNLEMISQRNAHNHLTDMRIYWCPQLESVPILLPSLDSLWIQYSPKVELFPKGSLPSNLKSMHLFGCSKLISSLVKGDLGAIPSLERLSIGEGEVESFPDEGLLPLSLTSLWVCNCPNLTNLNYKGLCNLSSLSNLYIRDCPMLECLPEEGLPKSISLLEITSCPLLHERCQEGGQDGPKIAHIGFFMR